jgi:threonine dehydratase
MKQAIFGAVRGGVGQPTPKSRRGGTISGQEKIVLETKLLDAIRSASGVIDPVFRDSPQFVSEAFGERLGVRVLCKVETINPIRSFKGRGCDYFLHCLGIFPSPLVTASAGNFGQGLAYAARSRGVPVIVLPPRPPIA